MSDRHIVSAFDRELGQIEYAVGQIGDMARDALTQAVAACTARDIALADQVRHADRTLDAREHDTRLAAIKLLALRAPSAGDLRFVLAVLEICSHLERCGDHAKNMAKRTHALAGAPQVDSTQTALRRMAEAVEAMLADALAAFMDRDADRARAVIRADMDADQRYNSLFRALLTHMMEDPRNIAAGMHLHFVAKNIERIGDRATGIAEQVIYLVTGALPEEDRLKLDATPLMDGPDAGPDS